MCVTLNPAAPGRHPAFHLPLNELNKLQHLKCYFDITDGEFELSASICYFSYSRNGDGAVPTERLK